MDVCWLAVFPRFAAEHTGRVQRIMIRRQKVDRDLDSPATTINSQSSSLAMRPRLRIPSNRASAQRAWESALKNCRVTPSCQSLVCKNLALIAPPSLPCYDLHRPKATPTGSSLTLNINLFRAHWMSLCYLPTSLKVATTRSDKVSKLVSDTFMTLTALPFW
jgi:hypothetical protein